ncbi:MAG: NAD-dependent epimerase/dehydratase family protein [Verrucomicrobia bacterium]|nr:NAD-dependent epimerase/dehydratase family protein [Verrucomicrobiota bacterium]
MSAKVLVTGGAGLIGSHIVDELLQRGYEVRVLDNLEPCIHLEGRPVWTTADVDFHHGDVRSQDDMEKALAGVEIIFHQAVYGGFAPELVKMADVNMTGTARIFEIIRTRGLNIRKVVTASSQAVYSEGRYECAEHGFFLGSSRAVAQMQAGDWEVKCPQCGRPGQSRPISEEVPVKVGNIYALSKHFEERLTLGLGREWGIPAVALRYGLTYGPRQSIFNPYSGICSIFSTRLLNGKRPIIYEDGRQTRDFTFVGDVARANLAVLENPAADYEVFNVGTSLGTPVIEFARYLARAYGSELEPETPGEYRPIDIRHLVLDNSRLRALGWAPTVPVEEGVRRYAEWILSMPRPQEYFTEAEKTLKNLRIVRTADRRP